MYSYDKESVAVLLAAIVRENAAGAAWTWLQEGAALAAQPARFNTAFALVPRKTGRALVQPAGRQQQSLEELRPGFTVTGWTVDRVARAWLLLHLDPADRDAYFRRIENLFGAAEMGELVALYSALPLLAYPEMWRRRCAEGIRNNIGDVLEAIMCRNPYPAEQLEEPAWNQLVLKAFFTEKPIHLIRGLDQRANPELAFILSDYAHERWAAHRPVNPLLWRCVGPFIDDRLLPDLERVAASGNSAERAAAYLACRQSPYPPAQALAARHPALQPFREQAPDWETLAQKAPAVD